MKPEKQQRVTEIIQALNTNLKIDQENTDTAKQENVIKKAAKKIYEDLMHIAKKSLAKENKLFASEMKKQLKQARNAERTVAIATLLKNNLELA
jgi:L-lactate utilization protein LutC